MLGQRAVLQLKHNETTSQMSATRQSWPNLQPLPTQHSALSLQREFTEQEYECICRGVIPESMEDKWFIFIEEDTLYMHRSWTGYCIYQLHLIRKDTTYRVGNTFVNRDASQYSWVDDRYDEKLVMFLIDSLLLGGLLLGGLLLGERAPFPIAAHVPVGIAQDLHLHHVVGAGQRAAEKPKELTILGILKWIGQWFLWLIKR